MEKAEKQALKTTKPVEKLTCRHVFVQGNKKGMYCGRNCRGDRCKDHKLEKLNKKRVKLDNDKINRIKNTGSIKKLPKLKDLEFELNSLITRRIGIIKRAYGVLRYLGEDTEEREKKLRKIVCGECKCEDPYISFCETCKTIVKRYVQDVDNEGTDIKIPIHECVYCLKSHAAKGYIKKKGKGINKTKYCTKCEEDIRYYDDPDTGIRCFFRCEYDCYEMPNCLCHETTKNKSNLRKEYCLCCQKDIEYQVGADICRYCFSDRKNYIEYEGRSEEHAKQYLSELKDHFEKNKKARQILLQKINLVNEKMNELMPAI
jgi:hypothetical protein